MKTAHYSTCKGVSSLGIAVGLILAMFAPRSPGALPPGTPPLLRVYASSGSGASAVTRVFDGGVTTVSSEFDHVYEYEDGRRVTVAESATAAGGGGRNFGIHGVVTVSHSATTNWDSASAAARVESPYTVTGPESRDGESVIVWFLFRVFASGNNGGGQASLHTRSFYPAWGEWYSPWYNEITVQPGGGSYRILKGAYSRWPAGENAWRWGYESEETVPGDSCSRTLLIKRLVSVNQSYLIFKVEGSAGASASVNSSGTGQFAADPYVWIDPATPNAHELALLAMSSPQDTSMAVPLDIEALGAGTEDYWNDPFVSGTWFYPNPGGTNQPLVFNEAGGVTNSGYVSCPVQFVRQEPAFTGSYGVAQTERHCDFGIHRTLSVSLRAQDQLDLKGGRVVFGVSTTNASGTSYAWYDDPFSVGSGGWMSSTVDMTDSNKWIVVGSAGLDELLRDNRWLGFWVVGATSQPTGTLALDSFSAASSGPAFIAGQPTSRSVNAGEVAALVVRAGGTPSLAYSWRKNGVIIPGGTTASLLLLSAQATDAGSYDVIVANASGSVTSAVASLTVANPYFVFPPRSVATNAGQAVRFSVTARGTPEPTLQWLKNGIPLTNGGNASGAQTDQLTLNSVYGADAGAYAVAISNSLRSVTSAVATLTVADPWCPERSPSRTVNQGQTTFLVSAAVGTPPLSYQWRKDGIPLTNGTASSLLLENTQPAHAGAYSVVISNAFGCFTSAVELLSVNLALADTFNPDANDTVNALAVQTDGKILVGGTFTSLAGVSRARLGRLNVDGTLDTAFNPELGGYEVFALSVQADGRVLVGGEFGELAGETHRGVGRLYPDGTLDASFNPGTDGTVHCLALQPDGKILLGGQFTAVAGQARTNLARLNDDGTLDTGFNVGTADNGMVNALLLQPDGKIVVGGSFISLAGQTRSNLGRLNADGTLDANFVASTEGAVRCLALQADSKILMGGTFTSVNGLSRTNLGRLNSDGSDDGSFTPNPNNAVYSLAIQADEGIVVGGSFSTLAGQGRLNIGRLRPSGEPEAGFDPRADGYSYPTAKCLAVQADGRILVGGFFQTLGGEYRQGIGRLNNTVATTESLSLERSVVTWLRGGSCPEVWRTVFDTTTNGADWVTLGAGTRIPGGWQVTGVSAPTNSTFRARGFVAGAGASCWCVETLIGPLMIIGQPANKAVAAGATARFNVSAIGAIPLAYQWRKDGTNLADAGNTFGVTTTSLTISNVQTGDMGDYSVVVSDTSGSVTSSVATLTFLVAPAITAQPSNQTVLAGQAATFNVSVTGTEPLVYRWRFNGSDIPGASTNSYTIGSAQATNAGAYAVVVISPAGSITSAVATLTVLGPPIITAHPASQMAVAGQSATFNLAATGTEPLTYQWRFNGSDIPGAGTNSYTITSTQVGNAGAYDVVVTNAYGSVTSAAAMLTILAPPTITTQPPNQIVHAGQAATLNVSATGTEPLVYQWQFNGVDIPGASTNTYTIGSARTTDAGSYAVVVTNSAGSVTSTVATLTVLGPPIITGQPTNHTVIAGQSASFNVSAAGTEPLTYQWRFNGGDIPGASTNSYAITSAQVTNSGSYDVVVINAYGSVISDVAMLTVRVPPSITMQPTNQTVLVGQAASFNVSATGTEPLSYQWRFYGNSIPGATTTIHTVLNAQGDAAGPYTVVVTNVAGSVTSVVATLTITNLGEAVYAWTNLVGLPGNQGTNDGTGSEARFSSAAGAAVDAAGNVFMSDQGNHTIRKVTPAGVVTTLAGLAGSSGSSDGTGSAARFYNPVGVAVDIVGNVFVADDYNHTIRKVTPAGVVTTLAGLAGNAGSTDGTGSTARFYHPSGVGVDSAGNVYVGDTANHTIRKITGAGAVTTLAGLAGIPGTSDGTGGSARFTNPRGLILDAGGNVFVADCFNHTIRKISPDGAVTTLAGSPGNYGSTDGTASGARFYYPYGLAVDNQGSVYVADAFNHTIRKVTASGIVTTLGGSPLAPGSTDGLGSAARFNTPLAMAIDSTAILYVADSGNRRISKGKPLFGIPPIIDVQPLSQTAPCGGAVTFTVTALGSAPLSYQWRFNGSNIPGATTNHYTIASAQLTNAGTYAVVVANTCGSVTSAAATLSVLDLGQAVYAWTTFTGLPGTPGTNDGTLAEARFGGPNGVAVDNAGNLFVADYGNHTIRKVMPSGVVTTLAGLPGASGITDGTGSAARFNRPFAVAPNSAGNVFVADNYNHTIRKVTSSGVVTTVAGAAGVYGSSDGTGTDARFYYPSGIGVDSAGNVFVGDNGNSTIRKISSAGVVTTLAGLAGNSGAVDGTGGSARFNGPRGLTLDSTGNVYVVDCFNHTVRKITSAGVVTTLAGSAGNLGSADGTGSTARFDYPYGLVVDSVGNLYVADAFNHTIRKVTAAGVVTTLGGSPGVTGSADGLGSAARFNSPRAVAIDSAGNLYVADANNARISRGTPIVRPAIIVQPAGQNAVCGEAATFTVTASGGALSYQWRFNSNPMLVATDSNLTVIADLATAGDYTVVVTNVAGSVTSDVAVLTVIVTPPVMLGVALTSTNTLVLAWPAALTGYTLEQNADLATTNWSTVNNIPDLIGSEKRVLVSLSSSNCFYRLKK